MRCRALVAVCLTLALGASVAWAAPDDAPRPLASPPPPPPPPPTLPAPTIVGAAPPVTGGGSRLVEDPGAPLPSVPAARRAPGTAPGTASGPAPDVRARPPEPPSPGWAVPGWDLDWRNRAAGLGPPLPPPDPWAIRPILRRHDTRIVSLDARRKAVKRVPQWVDVVERRDITEWRPFSLGDFARWMPNVMIADGGNPSLAMPVIRGLGRERVKIMTDGVWPSSQALGYHGGTLSLWDPESTERMEIYHGPGAYLKGIDSPGGIINIVPRRPRRHGRLSADTAFSTGYSSATGLWRGRAEADIGQDRVAGLIGVTWNGYGDRTTGGGTLVPSDYEQIYADLAADYFIDNRSRFGVTAQYAKTYDVNSPSATDTDILDPSFERVFLALTLTSFDVGSIFSGTRVSISLDSFFLTQDQAFADSGSGLGSEDDATRFDAHIEGNLHILPCHETWAELTVSYAHLKRQEQILSDGSVCPGVDEDANDGPQVDARLASTIDLPSRFADVGCGIGVIREYEAEEILVTALIEDQYHTECVDYYGGLRLDYYHVEDNRVDRDEDQVLVGGAGGVSRHLNRRVTAFANASLGWRRPSLYERTATAIVDGATIFGNPELDPELNANLEVGVKSSFKDRLSFEADVFGHYIDDFIGPVDTVGAVGDEKVLENLGDVCLFGAELTGAWRPCTTIEGWELFGTLGITRSTDTGLVANVPLLWRTGARYSVPAPRGYRIRRWFAEAAFHGATDSTDGRRGGGAYTTADLLLGTGVDFGDFRGATLGVGVTNVFDVDYTPPASVLPAPGASLFVNLGLTF